MLKVAIVGCGKIADAHASQILRIGGCEIVAVCDREPLMAKQLYERFPVKHYFDDLTELLGKAQPDVVHINIAGGIKVEIEPRTASPRRAGKADKAPAGTRCRAPPARDAMTACRARAAGRRRNSALPE